MKNKPLILILFFSLKKSVCRIPRNQKRARSTLLSGQRQPLCGGIGAPSPGPRPPAPLPPHFTALACYLAFPLVLPEIWSH